ncbi:hypothetical protein D9613_010032 [Agrocybe pediades]|uniref:GH16 domain-containing protein n=1 Tax=Agrocybe pediades TaxID=84607 RepID=A0A8H4QX86_9AGAR|nr:hypothetical protein D9613_010032 [Agrocybe pediades]KAF9567155.1 hypothetical protein CPC08DRAFT_41152 [Agrocybe pediades]
MTSFKSSLLFLTLLLGLCLAANSNAPTARSWRDISGRINRHSTGLVQDFRSAFQRVFSVQPEEDDLDKNIEQDFIVGETTDEYDDEDWKSSGSDETDLDDALDGTSPTTDTANPTPIPSTSPWKLVQMHKGTDFFKGWDFFTASDPTHGIVNYVDEKTARKNKLLEFNELGHAILRVETTPTVKSKRMSVRISTKNYFNGGIFILDATHIPFGCGVWPAFWTNGPRWPYTGEIDIVEAVNDYTHNQATLHTDYGCKLPSTSSGKLGMSGKVIGGVDCGAHSTNNQGCGIRAASNNTYGKGFNAIDGGMYAMKWDSTGIEVYFFKRGSIPKDIIAGELQPSKWGKPQARWPASSCNPSKYFVDHRIIFDTTLCGDWAGNVWGSSGVPGQERSCKARTGYARCEDFVRANGAAMKEAYWVIKSVRVWQKV